MSTEELLQAQIRMSAMEAAIALYCCQQGKGKGAGSGNLTEEFHEIKDLLIELRNLLLETTLEPGPI